MRVLPLVLAAVTACAALHDDGPTTATSSRYLARWTVRNTDTGAVLSSGCAEDSWLGRNPAIPTTTWQAAHASLMSVSAPVGAHLEESIELAYVTKTKSAGSTFPDDATYWCNADDDPRSSVQVFSSYACVAVVDPDPAATLIDARDVDGFRRLVHWTVVHTGTVHLTYDVKCDPSKAPAIKWSELTITSN